MYRKFFKRLFDIILALIAIVISSPFLIIISILVLIFMGWPILFKQPRPGKNEKIFNMYKFRTMTNKKDKDCNLLPDEQRLNKFGRFLRKTSLDELPEFFCILFGKMSFIGPRPLLESYLPYYTEEEHHRHDVRPGLTGLAQVNGRNNLDWNERFKKDLEYVNNITFKNDFKIIIETIKCVFKRENVEVPSESHDLNVVRKERKKMNILITSAGTRNKVVQYFKREFNGIGKVIATDMSDLAPAIYEADNYYLVPRIDDPNYIDKLLEICKKEKIDCLFALIDPELSLIAENKDKFLGIGVTPLISKYEAVELAFDKYEMFKYLNAHGFKTAKTYIDKNEFYKDLNDGKINFPVFVKPYKGSASININKVNSKEEIDTLFDVNDDLIIQEFMDGQEIGADVYIDPISKKVVSIFTKEKIKMRAGETDKAKSFKDDRLFDLITKLVEQIGYEYMIDMDIFKINDEYYISEINPRFGGGYPHAYESGINFPKLIINSMNGIENQNQIGNYDEDIYMMKYNEIKIIKK